MPQISTEALVGTLLLIALAVGYQYLPKITETPGPKGAKKKGRKKVKLTLAEEPQPEKQHGTGTKGKRKPSGQGDEVGMATKTASIGKSQESVNPTASIRRNSLDDAQSIPASAKSKTLAEKLAPKPRKTKVDE